MNLAGRIAATTADREVARTSLIGLANETGLTFAKELVPGILDNMDLAAKLGPAFKLISENPASGTFLMSARQAMQKPETARKALTDLLEFASAGAARKIIQWAPQYKGKSYDEFARAIGLENSYIKDVLNGVVPVDEATRKTIENVLATHGIQSPAAGARLVEKTGEQEALLPGKIKEQEALIPGKVKEQEALLPGQLKKSEELEKIKKKYDVEKPASESDIRGMRQEFTQLSKPFIEVRDTHGRIQAARKDPSAAGDLALIFNFMKMLDPASVVREGEFATAQDAAGVPDRVIAKYNALLKGERLTEATRTDFVKRADALYQSQLESQKKLEKEFRRIAKRRNIDPEDIIVDLKSEEMTSGGPVIKFVRDPKTGQLIPSQ